MNHKKKDCRRFIVASNSYGGIFDVDERKEKIDDLEKITADPVFWNDQKAANKVLKELNEHKSWTEEYDKIASKARFCQDEFDIAIELEDESFGEELTTTIASIEHDIVAIEFKNMLSGKDDAGNAMITIHAGAGGTEAQDWAEMLYRMYMRWAERKGFKLYTDDYQEGDGAGIKTATLEIQGPYAYGYLKAENGVHRLVRVSPYDSNARRHTSFARSIPTLRHLPTLKLMSARRILSFRPSAAAARADRTSTRWKLRCASSTFQPALWSAVRRSGHSFRTGSAP